ERNTMPFLFKLSKRVARLKDRVAAVSAALLAVTVVFACEKPLNVTDPGSGSSDVSRLVVFPKALTIQQNQTVDFTAVGLTDGGERDRRPDCAARRHDDGRDR